MKPMRNRRVLAIDDQLLFQTQIRRVLERLSVGHFQVVSDKAEFVRQLNTGAYNDVYVLDNQIQPGFNGDDAADLIVARLNKDAPLVYVLSATALPEHHQDVGAIEAKNEGRLWHWYIPKDPHYQRRIAEALIHRDIEMGDSTPEDWKDFDFNFGG